MSRVVDQKVVEMQFDNRHFERNVSTTMSTLDKLKQSLKLPDASKSLDGINKSAKNVNLSGIGSAVDTVQAKFSALQVAGVTALANITNSAVNYGKRIVKALTIDPVTTGFNEYELKMGSIQTIMAGTGESLERVNQKLNELNKYSDDTIYSFKDMTDNIGKFTNAGVGLDDAVDAIKGISNVAAISGANANEASRAMYNFSQALSAGYVQLIDWKSIELANMGTAEFRQQLIDSAVATGQLTKESEGLYRTIEGNEVTVESFRNTLNDKWLTSDVLIKTLKNYADGTTEIGARATAAATEVKTFSMMMDTLKESVQSGWAQTWEIVIGDFEEAKTFFTDLSNAIGGVIETISNARNQLLGDVLSSPWEQLSKEISDAGIELDEFKDKLKKTARAHNKELDKMSDEELTFDKMLEDGIVTKELVIETINDYVDNLDKVTESTEDMSQKLKTFQKVVDDVWRGDYKNGEARIKALSEAGYEYAEVQDLVNKTVDGHRLTLEDLNVEQAKALGYTDEQIELIKALGEGVNATDGRLKSLLDRMHKKTGRELLLESFTHILGEFKKILDAVGDAWSEVFGDVNLSDMIYNLIEKFHALSMELEITEDQAENFKKVFEGLFAVFQIGNMMFSMSLTAVIKILTAVLELFGTNIVDVATKIADYIIKLRDWIKENTIFIDTWDKIANILTVVISGIQRVINAIKQLPAVQKFIENLTGVFSDFLNGMGAGFDVFNLSGFTRTLVSAFMKLEEWINSLKKSENLGKDMVDGLILGLSTGFKTVVQLITDLATSLIEAFAEVIQSHSPSKVFFALGGFIILGLLAGLQNGFGWVLDALKNFATSCIDIFNNINLNHVIVAVFAGAMLLLVKKMMSIMAQFASLPAGIGQFFSGLGEMFENFGKAKKLKAEAAKLTSIAKIVMSVAFAIAAITAAMYILGNMENDQLIKAGTALAAMVVVIGLIMLLAKLMNKIKGIDTSFASIISIAGSLLLMSLAMVALTKVDVNGVGPAIQMMISMIASVGLLLAAFKVFSIGKGSVSFVKVGIMMTQMSIALGLMVGVIKLASMLTPKEIDRGLLTVYKMTGIFAAILAVATISPSHVSKVGGMMLKISVALLLMIGVIKLSALITEEELTKAIDVMGKVGVFFMCIIAASMLSGENAAKAGVLILGMAVALAAVVFVIKKVGELTEEQIDKGIDVIAKVSLLFAGIIAVSAIAGGNAIKAGIMLVTMATAMIVITGAIYLLASIPNGLDQALTAVAVVGLIFAGLIAVTKFAGEDVKGTIIAITVSITMLAIALAALSFIPEDKLTIATGAMLAALTALGLLMLATKAMGNVTGTLIGLSIAIGVLGGVLYLIGTLDTDSAMGAAMSLSGLLLVLGIVLTMLDKMNGPSVKAMVALGVVTLVVGALTAVLYFMQDVDATHALQITGVLTLFLAALLVALFAMQLLQAPSIMGLVALGVVTLVVAALAYILYQMQGVDPSQALGIVIALSIFLAAMTIVCFAAAAIGPVAGPAIIGLGVLLLFIGALGLVLLGLAELAMDVIAGMPKLGQDLSDFMTNAQGFIDGIQKVPDNIGDKVKLLCDAIGALTTQELFNSIKEFFSGGDSIADLGKELEDFGNSIASFTKNADVTSVTAVTDAITDLIDLDFSSSDANIENFHKSMEELADNAVDSFADELSSTDSKTKAKDAIGEVVTAASDKAKSQTGYNAFYDAGKSLVAGLAQGIRDKKSSATAAAQEVASAVETIIREAWEVNSPSKLFYRIALGIGEGITDGVIDSGSEVNGSAGLFADKVTKGFTKALDMVNSIISNDMDIQPTIRPVLDLSNVESGVGAMNGLLSNKTVGVNANIGAISTMMNARGQNGTNGDVVSAIDRLRKDLGKTGNTYNSINGITYDDGSEVSNAVRVLVRAAKIERRV